MDRVGTELTPQTGGVEIRVQRDRLPGGEPEIPVALIPIDPANAQDGWRIPNRSEISLATGTSSG